MNLSFTLILLLSFALPPVPASAKEPAQHEWQRIDSEFVSLFFDGAVTPQQISGCLKIPYNLMLHHSRTPKSSSPEDVLKAKLDTAFARVEEILNMYPRKIMVNVYIYENVEDLKKKYKELYNLDFANNRGEAQIISFYRYKENTISIYINHLAISVLAHEIAHCVVSHYFIIQPPVNTQEILAMYVDQHFNDV